MSPPGGSNDDKVFRFISDPGHKENLSGRVSLACIACRRKKVRCSGDVPCSTCKEKGIVCEGIAKRKRPNKKLDHQDNLPYGRRGSITYSSPDAKVQAYRELYSNSRSSDVDKRESVPKCPSTTLDKVDTLSSDDSGYSSAHQFAQNDLASSTTPRLATNFSINPKLNMYNSSTEISPSTIEPHAWSFAGAQNAANYRPTESEKPNISDSTHLALAATSTASVDWPDTAQPTTRWCTASTGRLAVMNLISLAEVLEEQAQALRTLALRHGTDAADNTRRQTVVFPLPSRNDETSSGLPVHQLDAFDDMAPLLPNCTQGGGFAPIALNCASCWPANPESSLEQGCHQPPDAIQHVRELGGLSAINSAELGWSSTTASSTQSQYAVSSQQSVQEAASFSSSAPQARQELYFWPNEF